MKAVFLGDAEGDLKELRQYLCKRFGPATWLETCGEIKAAMRAAVAFPQGGHPPPELLELGLTRYSQVLSGMSRVIYEVQGDMLYAHIVCDTRKDLKALLVRLLLHR